MEFLTSIDIGSYLSPLATGILILLFVVIVIGGWGLTLFGLPGNWLILLASIGFDWLLRSSRWEITLPLIIALAILAIVGEAAEFLAGSLGVAQKGGSRLSAVLALLGSGIGGILGAFVGIPLPIIGTIVGVLFFASAGALVGAMIGEDMQGRDFRESFGVGMAAFWGRLLGTLAKTLIGGVMVAVALVGLVR